MRDSKDLSPKRRRTLAKEIEKLAKDIVVLSVSACKIDSYRKQGVNLNRLEAMKFADALNFLNPGKAYVDAPDVKPERLKGILNKMIKGNVDIVSEHKADSKYPIVSAASIVAKVERDSAIEELKKKYGDVGPGYPSNPITMAWLRNWRAKHKEFPECVRRTWATAEAVEGESRQSKLASWFRRK